MLMAVRLDDGLDPGQGRRSPAALGQQFGQRPGLGLQLPGPVVAGQQLDGVRAQHRGAGRLQPDDRQPLGQRRRQRVEAAAQLLAGAVELPGGDPGQTAADLLGRDPDRAAGGLQHLDGGLADLW